MQEAKSNHRVNVVRIPDIQKHPNADSLGLVHFGGYQVVVKLGNFQSGDLAIYIQPDSVVPEVKAFEFLWVDSLYPDGVPERKRRVTVRKFRKEWSEGLLMPLADFWPMLDGVKEGEDVAGQLQITHYNPPEPGEGSTQSRKDGSKWPRSARGWFWFLIHRFLLLFGIDKYGSTGGLNDSGPKGNRPVYDVEAYKNHVNVLLEGEQVVATEKLHGSNARFVFDGKKMHAVSRKLWKSPTSNCVWRQAIKQNPWIEEWCRAYPNHTLYGEVVPTQGEKFNYGCSPGQVKFFVFDILRPNDTWVPSSEIFADDSPDRDLLHDPLFHWVPFLLIGSFTKAEVSQLVDGPSHIKDAKHIREGIVVRPLQERRTHGLGRVQLKLVSNAFLEMS